MAYRSRLLLASFLASLVGAVYACSNGSGDDVSVDVDSGSDPGSVLPPQSPEPDSGPGTGKDAGKDAHHDADAGKPAPNTGDPCPTLDQVFTRPCGACGTQQALCVVDPDGGSVEAGTGDAGGRGGIVSSYSVCTNELDGGCVPGTTANEACGNCGTRSKTCGKFCVWSPGACTGEPPGSCTPTTHDITLAGCATPGTFHTRDCTSTCTWTPFSPTCNPLDYHVTVGPNAGDVVSGIYEMRAEVVDKKMTGPCATAFFSTTANFANVYVTLDNPTDNPLTLSAWTSTAPNGGPQLQTLMAWYAGATKPVTDADRKTCAKGVVSFCPAGLPCDNFRWAGLTAANAITIPAQSSALLWIGSAYAVGAGSGSVSDVGNFQLSVRTDSSP